MNVDPEGLKKILAERIDQSSLTTQHLLSRCRLIDEDSRNTAAFADPRYLPFYYHLGKEVPAANLVEVGFRLGLPSACFLQGCRTVKEYLGFRPYGEEFYSPRLAIGNVKDHFRGNLRHFRGAITDESLRSRPWDVAIVDEEMSYDNHRACLDSLWQSLASGGLLVVDYLTRHEPSLRAFREFCATHGRESDVIPTRYGVGLIQK